MKKERTINVPTAWRLEQSAVGFTIKRQNALGVPAALHIDNDNWQRVMLNVSANTLAALPNVQLLDERAVVQYFAQRAAASLRRLADDFEQLAFSNE